MISKKFDDIKKDRIMVPCEDVQIAEKVGVRREYDG